jgi:biopolymer transport protein ExbD
VKNKLHYSLLGLAVPVGITACNPVTTTVEVDLPSTIDFSDGFQQSDADAIVRKCGAKDVKLEVKADGEITFEPSPNSDYEASACVLKYIKESGATKFGFVGNEKYVTE